jgi:hypothetical protein
VVAPLLLEALADLGLGLGVDQVDPDRLGLLEALDAVDRLDEVGELEADAGEDRAVAVALEVAARPGDDGLGRQVLDRPSEKSMIARSRSSRSWEPQTLTASGTAAAIARRSASRSCQSRKCSSGASSRISRIFATRASIDSRFSAAAAWTPMLASRNSSPRPSRSNCGSSPRAARAPGARRPRSAAARSPRRSSRGRTAAAGTAPTTRPTSRTRAPCAAAASAGRRARCRA